MNSQYQANYVCEYEDCEGFEVDTLTKHLTKLVINCPLCGRPLEHYFRGRNKRQSY